MKKSTKIILIAAGSTIFVSIILLITLALTINAQTITPPTSADLIKDFTCSASYIKEGEKEFCKIECTWDYTSSQTQQSITRLTFNMGSQAKDITSSKDSKKYSETVDLQSLGDNIAIWMIATDTNNATDRPAVTLIKPSATNPNTTPNQATTGEIGNCDNLQTNLPLNIKISTLSYIVCEVQSAIYKMIASVFDYGINVLRYYAGMRPDTNAGETEITEPPIFKDVQ